jgi:hypothetical protein
VTIALGVARIWVVLCLVLCTIWLRSGGMAALRICCRDDDTRFWWWWCDGAKGWLHTMVLAFCGHLTVSETSGVHVRPGVGIGIEISMYYSSMLEAGRTALLLILDGPSALRWQIGSEAIGPCERHRSMTWHISFMRHILYIHMHVRSKLHMLPGALSLRAGVISHFASNPSRPAVLGQAHA